MTSGYITTATGVDVDVDVYYSGSKALLDWSRAWWSSIDNSLSTLSGFKAMAGTHSDGKAWATSYDRRIIDALQMVSLTATAVHNYGTILAEMGYNHACAEHNATLNAGAAPEKPSVPQLVVSHCLLPPPSAGGPGQGLVDSGIGLLEQLNIIVPDGDRDKLDGARDAWKKIASLRAMTDFPVSIEAVARAFEACSTPESASIDEDLRALKASAEAMTETFEELAASCQDHRDALDDLRAKLVSQLNGMAQAFATEMAINAAVSVASSWVTFGVSVAAGLAGAALIVKRFSKPILEMIDAWRASRNLGKGVRATEDLSRHQSEMRRIGDLSKTKLRPTSPTRLDLTQQERDAIADYTGSAAQNWNGALRRGDVTPQMQAHIDTLNSALAKLPNYQGPVTRVTDLPDDVVAQYWRSYETGEEAIEKGFTSTSPLLNGGGVREGAYELQIVSKTGKNITAGAPNPEVLFGPGAKFRVMSRPQTDWSSGRTVFELVEI